MRAAFASGLGRMKSASNELFITRDFALFHLSMVVSGLAGETFRLAFAWWMLKHTDDTLAFGLVLTVMSACQIATRLFIGWIGDRFSPMRVIRVTFVLQALLTCVLSLMFFNGTVLGWPLMLLLGLFGACMGARDPLSNAAVTSLVPAGSVTKAMGQRGALSSVMSIAGPAAGGISLVVLGAPGAILLSAACILLTAAILFSIPTGKRDQAAAAVAGNKGVVRRFFTEWMVETWRGIRAFAGVRADFWLCLVTCSVNLVLPALFSIVIPYLVVRVYRLPDGLIGIFDICFAAGMIVSGMKVVNWLNARVGKLHTITIGLLGTALPYFFFAFSSNPYILGLGMFISGLGMLNLFSNVSGLRAVASPPRFRSRMFATASFLVAVSVPPGMWLTSALLTALGPTALLLISGSFIVCSAMFVYAVPQLSQLMRLSDEEATGAYERIYPEAFR